MRVVAPGSVTTFGSPPHGNNTVSTLQAVNDRRIAGALNMAYEMLMKDWSGISFAGGRLILQGVKQDARCRQKRLTASWLCRIWNRMVEEAVMLGRCSIPASLYGEYPEFYQNHKWTAPAWGYAINPLQEVQAMVLARNENLATGAESTAAFSGGDFEEVVQERSNERQLERDLNAVPPATAQLENKLQPAETPLKVAGKVAS